MLVSVSTKDGKVTSITYNNVTLILVGFIDGTNGGSNGAEVYIYSYLNPPVGNADVVVTLDSDYKKGIVVGATNFSWVNQTNPLGTLVSAYYHDDSESPFDLSVPSSNGDLVFDVSSVRNGTETMPSGQSEIYNINTGSETNGGSSTKIATSTSTLMSWSSSDSPEVGRAGVSIHPGSNTETTFVQSFTTCNPLTIKSGQTITVTNYRTTIIGSMPSNPSITAQMRYGSNNIITLSNPTYNSSTKLLTWTGTLGSDVIVPNGEPISLKTDTTEPNVSFYIDFDSQTKPSKITLPIAAKIDISAYSIYDTPYPGGSIITRALPGTIVYPQITAFISCDSNDINGVTIDIPSPGNVVMANFVDSTDCSKTYEYTWDTNGFDGVYSVPATAEGYSINITDTEPLSFTINNMQTFTSTNSFTVPCGITELTLEAWGAGGSRGVVMVLVAAALIQRN